MSKLREQMKMDLDLRGLSPKTKEQYLAHVEKFSKYFNKSPEQMGEPEIKQYLHFLLVEAGKSRSYNAQAYSAIKFLYETTLKKDWDKLKIPSSKKVKKLPVVLSQEEVRRIFNVVGNLKHRAILMTIYGSGLRVSEAVNLKPEDIDSGRMQLRIRDGKGKKDRYTLLSQTNLNILREYWKRYHPSGFLFSGAQPDQALTTRTVQRVFEIAVKKAGIKKDVSVHTLRHSFATHMLESGVDVYHIQRLLGHSSVKTTTVYLHIAQQDAVKLSSPLESVMAYGNE